MMKKVAFGIALLWGVTTVAVAADNEIRIGVVNPLTGISSDIGKAARNGAALAAAEINARGGIDGRKIVLVQYDDQGAPDVGEKVVKEAIATAKLHAFIGSVNTGVAVKTMPQLQKAKIPSMITSTIGSLPAVLTQYYNEPVNYIFRSQPPDYIQVQAIARELVAQKVKTVALFSDASPFGDSGKIQIEKELSKHGITINFAERYPVGVRDLEEPVTRAQKLKPDAVIVWGIGFDQAALKIAMSRVGWRAPLYGCYSLAQIDYLSTLGTMANGTRIAMSFSVDSDRPTAKHFMKNYYRFVNSSKLTSPQSAAAGYDGMYLMALAIQQAKSLEGEKIVQALENLEKPYYGIMKDYGAWIGDDPKKGVDPTKRPFSKTNHEAFQNSDYVYLMTAKDGSAVRNPDTFKSQYTIK